MEKEILNKEEYAAALAAKAEKAVKFLKTAVIITAVCTAILPAVSVILLIAADKAIYGLVGLCIPLGVFVAMLAVLACVFVYVCKQIKKLKSLDEENIENQQDKL